MGCAVFVCCGPQHAKVQIPDITLIVKTMTPGRKTDTLPRSLNKPCTTTKTVPITQLRAAPTRYSPALGFQFHLANPQCTRLFRCYFGTNIRPRPNARARVRELDPTLLDLVVSVGTPSAEIRTQRRETLESWLGVCWSSQLVGCSRARMYRSAGG